MDKARVTEKYGERHLIVNEELNVIAKWFPAVFRIATTSIPFTEPISAKFLAEQSTDLRFGQLELAVGTPSTEYFNMLNGSWFKSSISMVLYSKSLHDLLQAYLSNAYHCTKLFRHPVERSLYKNMPDEVYWSHMANNVWILVTDCRNYTHNQATEERKRHPKLSEASKSFELVASLHGHWHLVAEDDNWQPFRGNYDQSIFQARTNNSNLENEHDAHCIRPSRQLERTSRDIDIFIGLPWHKMFQ